MRQTRSESISACVGRACAIALCTSACSGKQAPVHEPRADAPAPAEHQSAGAPTATLDEVSARCETMQRSAEIPVTCQTDTIDEVPSMLVGFRSMDEANTWLGPFSEQIGKPFCDAAGHSGRPGRVYMAIGTGEERRGRRFSCELGQWGEWFPLSAHTGAMRPTLRDVVATCRRVQESDEIPITCVVDELGGMPTIIVGFGTKEDAEQNLGTMVQQVGDPFCKAANEAGWRAVFIVTIGNAEARPYDCAGEHWGEWFAMTPSPDLSRGRMH